MRWMQRFENGLLTEGNVLRALWRLAMPMLASAVLHNAQTLVDLFWVGRLGPAAVASVAMAGTVIMVLFPILMGLSTGTVALVARAVGAENWDEANRAAGQSLMLAAVFGVAIGLVGWFLARDLFRLLGADPSVMAQGVGYLKIMLLGSFTVFMLFIGNSALQSAGDTLTPMFIMGMMNVLNVVLDPILIFGLGPLPEMGVEGAAVATVLSNTIAAWVLLFILFRGKTRIHIRLKQWKPDLTLSWRILRIGIPGSGQMLSRSLMWGLMMRIVAGCGTAAVAAYGTGMRLHTIALMPAFALAGAAATMVGQNMGAKRPERARSSAWLAAGLTALFMALVAVVMMIFAPTLIRIFNSDPGVVRIGAGYLLIVSPFHVFAALGIVFGRALNGAGDSVTPMIFTVVSLWLLQAPLAIVFSRLWDSPTQGIWWAISIVMVVHGLLTAAWFETGKWRSKRV